MIHIKGNKNYNAQDNKSASTATMEAWGNFLISVLQGHLNYQAYKQNIPVEIERRASFGFTSPTLAPTGESIRLSMGIIPAAYADILVSCLTELDELLGKLFENPKKHAPILKSFYGSKPHKKYLNKKYKTPKLHSLLQLLFAKTEKTGKTTVLNIMRSASARESIAIKVFEVLNHKSNNSLLEAFQSATQWAINQISVTSKNQLSFSQDHEIRYKVKFTKKAAITNDEAFWNIIQLIANQAEMINVPQLTPDINAIRVMIKIKDITQIYATLELLNEHIYVNAVETSQTLSDDDACASESEEESTIDGKNVSASKIITQNGMRSILASVESAARHVDKATIYLEGSYYECPFGIKLIGKLNYLNNVTMVKDPSAANIILQDINPCITNGKSLSLPLDKFENKFYVLDATSTRTDDIHKYVKRFVKSRADVLFIAASGMKHQQFGADKNPHGIIRIIGHDKKTRKKYHKDIKKL